MGRDPFRIDHGFIGGHIQMQVLLVNAPEGTQVGAKRYPRSFAGVAVDLADAIVIILTCPLPSAVAHRGMGRMAAVIALPFIRVQDCALPRDILGDQGAQVRLSAWSHTQKRCSPVSREITLMMGGRSLA